MQATFKTIWKDGKITYYRPLNITENDEKFAVPGGCQCFYCKANPEKLPMWDCLAADNVDMINSHLVHFPQILDSQIVERVVME